MRSAILWLAVLLAFVLASDAGSQTETVQLAAHTFVVQGGAPAGGDWVNIPLGSVGGIRDVQCGIGTDNPKDWNCDFGAGDAQHRGDIVLNYDVGRCVTGMDGFTNTQQSAAVQRSHMLFKVCPGKRPWAKRPWRIGGRPPS